jgi:hypothetical protein
VNGRRPRLSAIPRASRDATTIQPVWCATTHSGSCWFPSRARIEYRSHPEVLRRMGSTLVAGSMGFPSGPSMAPSFSLTDVGNRAPFGPAYNAGRNRTALGLAYPGYRLRKIPRHARTRRICSSPGTTSTSSATPFLSTKPAALWTEGPRAPRSAPRVDGTSGSRVRHCWG